MGKKNRKTLDYRSLSIEELYKTCDDLKSELRKMRFDRVLGTNFNLVSFRTAKKNLARVMTAMSLKELGGRSE